MTSAHQRRDFMRLAASSLATAALAPEAFAQTLRQAMSLPANNRTGSIQDVEHIVILMQENRSFDHYFGSMRGVRGFGDPRPVTLTSGKPVWYQPNGNSYLLPFRPAGDNLGLQYLEGTPHGWGDSHAAWNHGRYDQWASAKGSNTMTYLTRKDIPYHYQLADAFTVCDAYHCSVMGPTDPNRYYMWTGWTGNDGRGGGPVISNAEVGYDWSTYPEVLERAGVSWKIYQDVGTGLDAAGYWGWTDDPFIGNYGDNSLLYFHQYQNALPGSPLYEKARTGTNISLGGTLFDVLKQDIAKGSLPQVSWVVAPEAYSEHANWPANYGAWYIDQVIQALTADPVLWSKTALFVTYDENDGLFDHMVPPFAPYSKQSGASTVSTAGEFYNAGAAQPGPYGLGVRVPMIVVSPWSRGGWVCSQVFDHTSLIRFIEKRFGSQYAIADTNTSLWRRTVCGDLTAAFNFAKPNEDAKPVQLPDTKGYYPPDFVRHNSLVPVPPTKQTMPLQEPGVKRARALPYELGVLGRMQSSDKSMALEFHNTGRAGVSFYVNSPLRSDGPWVYTVEAGRKLSDSIPAASPAAQNYDFSVHGPNGFLCQFKGRVPSFASNASAEISYRYDVASNSVLLTLMNPGSNEIRLRIANRYDGQGPHTVSVPAGKSVQDVWKLEDSHGWYDISVSDARDDSYQRRIAGHLENGRPSISDPALGTS